MAGAALRRRRLHAALIVLFAWLAVPLAAAPAGPAPPGILTARPGAVTHPGDAPRGFRRLDHETARGGILYVPSTYDPGRPAPLLLFLHGAGGDPRRAIEPLKRHAEAHGAILMAPAAAALTWDLVTERRYGRDARAIDALLREVFARYAVDPARIGIAGFSDGGSYALSLGLSNGDLFGRILAFSPGFVLPLRQVGKPQLFVAHGRADTVLPIDVTSRRVAATLRGAGYDLDFREFGGGHVVPAPIAAEAFALAMQPPTPVTGDVGAIPLAAANDDIDHPPLEKLLWPNERRRVARWTDPVCLRVEGAASTLADQLAAEIRGVAATVGAATAVSPCRANLTVKLVRGPGRSASWDYGVGRETTGGGRRLKSATILLDKERAEAMPAYSVGAYAAMVGLAEIALPALPRQGTLLALFEGADAPQRPTTRDIEFLRRLYAP
jgi:phospholipase/carboxylesterase